MTSASPLETAPHGLWPSPISAELVAAGASPLTQLELGGPDGQDIFWLAGRASEAGRNTLLRRRGGGVAELTPLPFNVRTRVHEYGGGAYAVAGDTVYFSHFTDNRIHVKVGDADAVALTAADERDAHVRHAYVRHADFIVDEVGQRLIGVRELHPANGHAQPDNCICAIAINNNGAQTVLAEGHDFYAAPRLSPDGAALAWLSWNHPRMPWQGTELWLADVQADGTLSAPRLVAGGADESVCQPEWSPDGVLHFVSDRSGWWNLYRLQDGAEGDAAEALCRVQTAGAIAEALCRVQTAGAIVEALCPMQAEFASPHWTFGVAMYGFRSAGEIVCTYIDNGVSKLARLLRGSTTLHPIANPYQEIRELRVAPGFVALLGGAPTIALELARIDFSNGELEVLARSIGEQPADDYLSVPESVSYLSSGGRVAHAFFYAPHNADYCPEPGSKPPVIVISHGGPTSMASNTLKLATQFWTSRGFGVLDVNYGGSSGFGRVYRDALKGQWGIVDVDDCIAGAQYLVAHGLADGARLIIRGGSAGGLTTLCALTFHDVFKAGASYYGVSDLKGLDQDSHKFESHYNEYLIAPAPQAEALYQARSPINHTARLMRPMIFFQGLDDKVVPPQQSQLMVDALKARGVPVAYLPLEGEGHGFRKAENIALTLRAELYFYLRVFGLIPAATPGAPAPVDIDNLPQ